MELIFLLLLLVSLVCFGLAAFGRLHSRIDLVSLGLFFVTLVLFLKTLAV